jgi:hypothetical protein
MKTLDAQGAKLTADEKVAVDKTGTDTRYGADLVYTNYTGEVGNSRHVTRREYGGHPPGRNNYLSWDDGGKPP